MTTTQHLLTTHFPDLTIQLDYPLAPLTYFKIGGPAEAYLELDEANKLVEFASFCKEHSIPWTVLGGASNVIVADEGITGVVIRFTNSQVVLAEKKADGSALIRAGAGIKTALLVRQTIDWGYQGLEYFLGVPGVLGGAVYNNAHYLQDLIGSHISRVQVVDESAQLIWLGQQECEFGYDRSRFHRTNEIITQIEFHLQPGDKAESLALIKKATQYRATTQPLGEPSSGCIFQNVPNTPALKERFPQFADRSHVPGGFLIDQAELKNTHIGDIYVSDKHAAFFVNKGQGTAAQVRDLITLVKETVQRKFGVQLQEEVVYLH